MLVADTKDKLEEEVIQMNLDANEKLRKKNLLSLARRELQLKNQRDSVVILNSHMNENKTDLLPNNFLNENSCSGRENNNVLLVNDCLNKNSCLVDIEREKQKKQSQKDILLLARKQLQTKNHQKIIGFNQNQFDPRPENENRVCLLCILNSI